ncbi:DUF397 domain-containing protein [Glycomyces sp. YM15]|uniref:DUF397 domain-containing protein n=1 Tax=Glycomyces sp. YM15 TaxID=2800446 RepID=UPI0035AB8EC2
MSQGGWRKSSRSQGANTNCVELAVSPWRKASRSQGAEDSGVSRPGPQVPASRSGTASLAKAPRSST